MVNFYYQKKKIINYYEKAPDKYYYTKEKYPHYFLTEEDYEAMAPEKRKEVRVNIEEQIDEMYQLRRGLYGRKIRAMYVLL